MRALFALLVLVNLAVVIASPGDASSLNSADAREPSLQNPSLVLIAEIPLAERPGKRAVVSTEMIPEEVRIIAADDMQKRTTAGAQSCYRFEGIPDEETFTLVKSRLSAGGARLDASGELAAEKRRYWVVLPRFTSRAQAEPVMRRLREAGVGDFYFISAGENRNTISLGLFSSADAAQRRVRELASLKLMIDVREVVSLSRAWYLEVYWERRPDELKKLAGSSAASMSACSHS